jgi:hypothetical protein
MKARVTGSGDMGRSILAVLVLALSSQLVQGAEESCRVYRVGDGQIEWIENGEQRGGRFVSRTAEWEIRKYSWYVGPVASCESCLAGLSSAVLWLYTVGELERDLDQRIAPDAVAHSFHNFPVEARAKTEPVSVVISGLVGRARVLRLETRDLSSRDAIALVAAKGCGLLFGILVGEDGVTPPIDQIASLDALVGIEWYKPEHDPEALKPPRRHDEDLLLGDARKRARQDR